jgi:hypothetical protein
MHLSVIKKLGYLASVVNIDAHVLLLSRGCCPGDPIVDATWSFTLFL